MAETRNDDSTARRRRSFFIIVGAAVLATIVGVALLMNIFERKQEARNAFYRVVELTDDTEDPAIWGKNFPCNMTTIYARWIRCAPATAAVKQRRTHRRKPIRAQSSLSRRLRKTRV